MFLVLDDKQKLPSKRTLHFERMIHDTLQKEHARGTNDIQPGIFAFAMQQHDAKFRVLVKQLRSSPFSAFINPDRRNTVGLESVVDDYDCQPKAEDKQRLTHCEENLPKH